MKLYANLPYDRDRPVHDLESTQTVGILSVCTQEFEVDSFSVYVQEVLDAAPALSDEKRETITAIITGGDAK